MRRLPALHPFLLAVCPALVVFLHNRFEVPLHAVLPALAACLGAAGAGWFGLRRWLVEPARASIVLSLLVAAVFVYGSAYDGLVAAAAAAHVPSLGRHRVLLGPWLLVFAVGIVRVARSRRDLAVVARFLDAGSAAVVVLLLAWVVWFEAAGRLHLEAAAAEDPEWTERDRSAADAAKPDIYFIVLDRCASQRTLQHAYGSDDRSLTQGLESRGFYVASRSRCNYPGTFLSLASTLNLEYMDALAAVGRDSRDRTAVHRLLADNKVQRYVRSEGYRYVHVGSWWEPTRRNPHADENVACGPALSEFTTALLGTTLLDPFLSRFLDREHNHRGIVLAQWHEMQRIVAEPGPKFVFLHSLVTHDPYVFDRDGGLVGPEERARRGARRCYVDQYAYATTKTLELVDRILAGSRRPPVILLAADEGPALDPVGGRNLLTRERVAERTGILQAFHFPGVPADRLHPGLSPVNSFRLLFDLYFGARYPLLADRTFWSEDPVHLYRFEDVTERDW